MLGKNKNLNKFLIVKPMTDPKLRYITAKKLAEMCPDTAFMEWKSKLDAMETVVMKRSKISMPLDELKKALESIHANVEMVQQKSIGGKPVF